MSRGNFGARSLVRRLGPLACIALIALMAPKAMLSQETTAGITGTVTDPSGAPVVAAKVTATDALRGTTWPAFTNSSGIFDLPRLPVSTYDISAGAAGFQTSVQKGIVLELDQRARVDIHLQLGSVSETVEVTGSAPLLQTDTMQVGTVISSKINQDLPLATRNYVELTLLAPGVTNPNPSSFTNGQASGNGGRPFVNGNREQSDNFLLDGMDNNQVSDNLVGYAPSVDAIQEFNMITSNAPAEFGNFQGGIISATIKSGTNQFHGALFEFLRNDVLNAAQWSQNISKAPGTPDNKAKMRWNMFGGTVGGPIKKDKIFFFGDYQGERFNNPASTGPITVFTLKERNGDFSEVCSAFDATGTCTTGIQLYNPNKVDASGNRALVPFNNLAAAGLTIDPVAQKLFSSTLYPAPINGDLRRNQLNTHRGQTIGDQFDVKIDATLTEKDRLSGRFSWSRLEIPGSNSFPLFFNSFQHTPTRNAVVNWTRTLSPSLVNEARIGVNYVKLNNGGADNGLGNVGQNFGIAGANDRGPGLPSIGGFTYVNGIGNANIGTQQLFADTVIQAEDSLIITHGRHIVHTGFQFFRQRVNTFYAGNNGRTGNIKFDGRWTAGPSNKATSSGAAGLPEADFYLGLPEVIQRGIDSGTWGQRANVFAGHFQDDWRFNSNLTLNLGLRYETHTPWVEVHDRQANFGLISGTEYFAGKGSCPYSDCRGLYNSYNGGFDFQPRLGFAWTPFGKSTVIRGAYTVSSYLEGTGTNLRLPLNPPFALEHNTTYDALTYPASTTSQGFTVLTSQADPFAKAVIRLWNPDVKPSLSQQWNLAIQHQFPGDTVVNIAYVGQYATHLMNPMPYFQKRLPGTAGCPSTATTPCASPYLSGNPALAGISQISGTESNANMIYHGLQTTFQKRFSQGLQYQVAYTYSKCMTNSIGYYGSWGGQVVPTAAYWQNLYDGRSEWGPCINDVTHLLSSYAVYELPFGRGKKFGSNWHPVVNGVLGNWQMSGILQLRGGFGSTVFAGDATGTGARTSRANCLSTPTYPKTPAAGGGIQWVDPAAYGPESPGQFGTCGVATLRGPGLRNFDLNLQKEFPLSESKRLEFRTEFINFTNTPILNAPGVFLGGSFGRITSSQGARNIQFGLKLYY